MSSTGHSNASGQAASSAAQIRQSLKLGDRPYPVGIVLGTGWGDALGIKDEQTIPFRNIPGGFSKLVDLPGHDRTVSFGRIDGVDVVVQRGRIHLYESVDPRVFDLVRLQTDMLMHLGVRTLIVTSSAGALAGRADVGDLVLINAFSALFAPPMPLEGHEHVEPEDAIDYHLAPKVLFAQMKTKPLRIKPGGYVMTRGPGFESRKLDKQMLAQTGAAVVGMSMLPEAYIVAAYNEAHPDARVGMLPVAFVANDDKEPHRHETIIARTRARARELGDFVRLAVSFADASHR